MSADTLPPVFVKMVGRFDAAAEAAISLCELRPNADPGLVGVGNAIETSWRSLTLASCEYSDFPPIAQVSPLPDFAAARASA